MALHKLYLILFVAIAFCCQSNEARAGHKDGSILDDAVYFHANEGGADIEFTPNGAHPETFQSCMLACIDPDICCSCKESGKISMTAAVVNDLSKECIKSEIATCTEQWTKNVLETAIVKGRANNCTSVKTTSVALQRCSSSCMGKPFSKPLNPYNPSAFPGFLDSGAELSVSPTVDLTDFCQDIRAEGLLCSWYRSDAYTAGNTMCRSGTRCGYHGYSYSWCFVDYQDHWDYCCTGSCGFNGQNYMWCSSGSKWQYCGDAGDVDIKGRHCLANYPCGMHQEVGKAGYYWCYIDTSKNWERCCEPWNKCSSRLRWCYTGYKKTTGHKECSP